MIFCMGFITAFQFQSALSTRAYIILTSAGSAHLSNSLRLSSVKNAFSNLFTCPDMHNKTSLLILTSSLLFLVIIVELAQVSSSLESNFWETYSNTYFFKNSSSLVLKLVKCLEAEGLLILSQEAHLDDHQRQYAVLNLSGGLRNLFLRFQNAVNILFGTAASDLSLVLILALGVVPVLMGIAAAMTFILGPGVTALISLLIPLAGFGLVLLPAITLMQIPQSLQ